MTLEHEIQALSDDEIINALKCERLRMLAWVLTHSRQDCIERARAILSSEIDIRLICERSDTAAEMVDRLEAVLYQFADLGKQDDSSVLLREEAAYQAGEMESMKEKR